MPIGQFGGDVFYTEVPFLKRMLVSLCHVDTTPAHRDTYLPGENVAVFAELQRVSILLSPGVTPDQLKIHLLPIQLSLVRQDQSLADLKIKRRKVISGEFTRRMFWGFLVPKICSHSFPHIFIWTL